MSNFVSALVGVLSLIVIIVAGGFLIFFLGDLLLCVLDPKYSSIFKRMKKGKEDEKKSDRPIVLESNRENQNQFEDKREPYLLENTKEDLEDDRVVFNDFDRLDSYDEDEAKKEEQLLNGGEKAVDPMADLKTEEEEFRLERLRLIEERRKAIEEEQSKKEEETKEVNFNDIFVEDDDDSLDDFDLEDDEDFKDIMKAIEEGKAEETKGKEEAEEPEEDEEAEELPPTIIENVDNIQNEELKKQIEELKAQLENAKREKDEIVLEKHRLEEIANQQVEVSHPINVITLEEAESKLEVLKTRLKANEKEFKFAKKEYLPLFKIQKSLENDKKKLRRKEALVAKQKVVLYGVNNVVDIDQEKAKKLAEDLDLLDGLRLSVGHCEEVIETNKERLPLLEKAYTILKTEHDNIKADIENLENIIASLKTENGDGETSAE